MSQIKAYKNRMHAGKQLAQALGPLVGDPGAVVLGLPRGGVPVAFAVARELKLPLDILLVKKLGMPGHEEFAIGAVASGGVRVVQKEAARECGLDEEALDAMCSAAMAELNRRERKFRGGRAGLDLAGRTVILVDDGIATGASLRAAIAVARAAGCARLIAAAPVGAPDTCAALAELVDLLVCPLQPPRFHAVGQWYREFDQTDDAEVIDLLAMAWRADTGPPAKQIGAGAR